MIQFQFDLKGANNYTFDEIQVALANCSNGDPLSWLNENWTKLIETVQTLATKYGQEHKENIVGTISSAEAREVLIKNKGSVWHAVTQCIEQRQQAFNTITSQGNYSREDIVSSLTAHNGNVESALAELNRLQMKPFLLKIQGPPADTLNEPTTSLQAPGSAKTDTMGGSSIENENHDDEEKKNDDKTDILRDIEAIIGSMEEKQSKQTETLLSTIESLVGNMMLSQNSRSISSASSFNGLDRIDAKSPIVIPSKVSSSFDQSTDVETSVKNFVSMHIQDVVPDVAALINKELTETPTENIGIDQGEASQNEQIPIEEVEVLVPIVAPEQLSQPAESIEPAQVSSAIPLNQQNVNATTTSIEKPNTTTTDDTNQMQTIITQIEPIQNASQPLNDDKIAQQPSRTNKPRFVVNKAGVRYSQKQIDKKRIRELEKQLRKEQRRRSTSIVTDRSDSQNTGYLSDSTVVADETQIAQNLDVAAVSNEKTFSLSIIEQAANVNDNKEHNHTITSSSPQNVEEINLAATNSILQQLGESSASGQSNDTTGDVTATNDAKKDAKNRNLSELVEHTKSLIQQMKNEIDEDIAASASEFGDGDNDDYLSDDLIYSDELIDGSEFSDSWEDISDGESVVSGDERYSDQFENDDREIEFQRSSQSMDSEYFVEARESQTSENEQLDDEDLELLENIDVIDDESIVQLNGSFSNQEGINLIESNAVEPEFYDVQAVTNARNDERIQQIIPGNEIIDQNPTENQILEQTIATNENSTSSHVANSPIDSVLSTDNNLMEHLLEIQQSLHSSSIISVNFRETQLREKSESVEPSLDSRTGSNVQSPDALESGLEAISETINADQKDIVRQAASIDEPSTSETIEITEGRRSEASVASVTTDQNETVESASNSNGSEHEATENAFSKEDEEQSISDNQQSVSASASDNQISHANDTESEMDELSVDVSASESSSSKDNISVHSAISTISTVSTAASEKLVESYQYKKITVPVITQCSSSSINVMQLKKNTPDKSTVKNKIPVRRPSLTEPSPSIRNIQNELLNKQLRQPPKVVSKKPSKIVPPKLFFKSNSAAESMASLAGPSKPSKLDENKPSTSNGKLSIPKKKYYETCFSDDNYQTSDDEKPITNMKVIPNLVKIVESHTEESPGPEVRRN